MATASELLDALHRIREEDADRSSSLSAQEYLSRLEDRVAALRARLNLSQTSAHSAGGAQTVDVQDTSSRR